MTLEEFGASVTDISLTGSHAGSTKQQNTFATYKLKFKVKVVAIVISYASYMQFCGPASYVENSAHRIDIRKGCIRNARE